MDDHERALGRLEGRMQAVEREVHDVKTAVTSIKATVDQSKGGWRVLVAVAGIAGSIGALIGKFAPFLTTKP